MAQLGKRMIKIYIADTTVLSEESVFQKYFDMLDDTRKEKVRQCKQEKDKKRSLLAGYLLQAGVREWINEQHASRAVLMVTEKKSGLQADATPLSLTYRYGENGKPYLENYPNIYFSLSHSGDYVVCAFSDKEVGVDIQEHRELKTDIAGRFFSSEDKELLQKLAGRKTDGDGESGKDIRPEDFYHMWAVKEAYMKLTGEGMRQGLENTRLEVGSEGQYDSFPNFGRVLRLDNKGENAYFRIYEGIKEYSIAVCSFAETADIKIKKTDGNMW